MKLEHYNSHWPKDIPLMMPLASSYVFIYMTALKINLNMTSSHQIFTANFDVSVTLMRLDNSCVRVSTIDHS